MVRQVAEHLEKYGYNVKADHIEWKNGAPDPVNDYVPDIVATRGDEKHIMEIETCPTFKDDEHTKPQLKSFESSEEVTHVIIPNVCLINGKKYDPVPVMKAKLKKWKITKVHVGVYSPSKGKPQFDR